MGLLLRGTSDGGEGVRLDGVQLEQEGGAPRRPSILMQTFFLFGENPCFPSR